MENGNRNELDGLEDRIEKLEKWVERIDRFGCRNPSAEETHRQAQELAEKDKTIEDQAEIIRRLRQDNKSLTGLLDKTDEKLRDAERRIAFVVERRKLNADKLLSIRRIVES